VIIFSQQVIRLLPLPARGALGGIYAVTRQQCRRQQPSAPSQFQVPREINCAGISNKTNCLVGPAFKEVQSTYFIIPEVRPQYSRNNGYSLL
jgi:hypothetical protein